MKRSSCYMSMREQLKPGEQAARDHLNDCEECRSEQAILTLFSATDTSDPAPPLENLDRRRLLQSLVDKHRGGYTAPQVADAKAREPSPGLPFIRFRFALAGAVLGLALGVIATALILLPQNGTDESPSELAIAPTTPALDGYLALVSGRVKALDESAEIGHMLEPGGELSTQHGKATVAFSHGLTLSLGEDTRLRMPGDQAEGLIVQIMGGRLLASVAPGSRDHPLTIQTRLGSVIVTGTVLEVIDSPQHVEVAVLRGEVVVRGSDGGDLRIAAMQTLQIGTGEIRLLDEPRSEELWDEVIAMGMLNSNPGSRLTVRSAPDQARVSVDGTLAGRTPISLALRPGHHRLRVWHDEERLQVGALDLGEGESVVRTFDFSSRGETADGAVQEEDGGLASPPSPSDPPQTARQLLDRAQRMRSERRIGQAAEAFRELLRRYPRSAEASTCAVSLANIELDHLRRPTESLRLYDRYLSNHRDGVLAQEALFGKARALRALGRRSAEVDVLRQFLQRFPQAFQSDDARERLNNIAGEK